MSYDHFLLSPCKDLGIHLDGLLGFNHHIEYVMKKLNEICGRIYNIRHF